MKATVEVTTTIDLDVDDAVVAEVMSEKWQSSFYTFQTQDEVLAWLGWVVEKFGGPEHVDRLVGIGRVDTQLTGRDMGVTSVSP